MRFKSIETTPNPNSMKLNFEESLGKAVTYTAEDCAGCPEFVSKLLAIAGVKSVFVCQDFVTLNRDPRSDWKAILEIATEILSGKSDGDQSLEELRADGEKEGQVSVLVQTYLGVPIQVKVLAAETEKRLALASRFMEAVGVIRDSTDADFLKERYWADWGVRYGEPDIVAQEVVDEIEGTVTKSDLERLVAQAKGEETKTAPTLSREQSEAGLSSTDWRVRLRTVQDLGSSEDDIPFLCRALTDEHMQVRRLAAAALGATGNSRAVAPLCLALLNDPAVGVRRTAGDALSDIGDPSCEEDVCQALVDKNKLVRWRAARFLAEAGTSIAIPALERSLEDPEFEVRLEIQSAINRINGGAESTVPVWKRMQI